MRILSVLFLPVILASCQQEPMMGSEAKAATQPSAANPVVVELFQSQGCSSCPPANAALNAIADRSDVIALNFSVTYWDRLGWKDIFGNPAYTQRQYDYAKSLGSENVYTPQIVLNGTRAIVGTKAGELNRAITALTPISGGPTIISEGAKVSVGAGNGSATVWLVRYDPRTQNVAIRSGENSGRTLPHKNIVRQLSRLGNWNGKAVSFTLPKKDIPGLQSVILVQQGSKGAIIAARRI
jgi:hypothetical protein